MARVEPSVQLSIIVWAALSSKFKSLKIIVQFTCIGASFAIEFLRFVEVSQIPTCPDHPTRGRAEKGEDKIR